MTVDGDQLTVAERAARGKVARAHTPRASHADFKVLPTRVSPISLLEEQATTRVPELVPIRHGRMLVSPFTYYRGAALPMASDLAETPTSGIRVQVCGDAHLSNFGMFGSPERHLFFDVNDFDETAPGPWEWDVKRLAASLEIAGRDHDFSTKRRAAIVQASVRAYREAMREFAGASMLDVWYSRLDMDALAPRFQMLLDPKRTPSVWNAITKARAHDSHQAFDKLCSLVSGTPRFVHDPPLIVPLDESSNDADAALVSASLQRIMDAYRKTLDSDRRRLVDQYRVAHLARKVVGVGSVGTEAWIVLLLDRVHNTPLLLQIKQAEASVLERYTAKSAFANHGHRVVAGQRLMQAASDIFLGWERFPSEGDAARDYYLRQLRDWKGSADIAGMTAAGMALWAEMCGWTLARPPTPDPVIASAIASYLGKADVFDRAIVEFSAAYANQNEKDYAGLQEAVRSGRLTAHTGV